MSGKHWASELPSSLLLGPGGLLLNMSTLQLLMKAVKSSPFLNILFPFVSHPSPIQLCMETHCEKISPLLWLLWCLDRFMSPACIVLPWLLIGECLRHWEGKAGSVFMSGWESKSGAVSRTNRDAGLQLFVWRDKCSIRSTRWKRIWIYLKACGCNLKGNRTKKQQVYIF